MIATTVRWLTHRFRAGRYYVGALDQLKIEGSAMYLDRSFYKTFGIAALIGAIGLTSGNAVFSTLLSTQIQQPSRQIDRVAVANLRKARNFELQFCEDLGLGR